MEIRNPKFNRHGTIDVELEVAPGRWVPFTASPNDVEEHGREIFAEASKLDVAPYVAPEPPPPPPPTETEKLRSELDKLRGVLITKGVVTDEETKALSAAK